MPLVVFFFSLALQGEIRACAFNQVAEKLNSTFEMGKVSAYYYSKDFFLSFNTTPPSPSEYNHRIGMSGDDSAKK